MKGHKNFFLISFIPALAYWYLEANYSLKIALWGGLGLAVLEILCEKIFTKHVHTISLVNLFLILFLGGLSLLGDDGIWFKLQPFFTGIGIGGFLLFYRYVKKQSLFEDMIKSFPQKVPPPPFVLQIMELHVSLLFLFYGLFMAVIAFKASTEQWLFFKTIGFYIVFGVFMLAEMIYLRLKIKRIIRNQERAEILKRF